MAIQNIHQLSVRKKLTMMAKVPLADHACPISRDRNNSASVVSSVERPCVTFGLNAHMDPNTREKPVSSAADDAEQTGWAT